MRRGTKWEDSGANSRARDAPVISLPQIVAYNVKRGRQGRGYSQHDLCERLEGVTGRAWSVAVVSAAEAGWAGKTGRVRAFDVNDLVAFAVALQLPFGWFVMPPLTAPHGAPVGDYVRWIETSKESEGRLLTPNLLRWMALGHTDPEDPDDLMGQRVRDEAAKTVEPPPRGSRERHLWIDLVQLLEKYEEHK